MATYNSGRVIWPQLTSIANQTYLPERVLIVDDASSDQTFREILNFQRELTVPIEVIQNKTNLGHVRSFENGLKKTRADVVFLCDHDDFWLPNKIERTLYALGASDQSMPCLAVLHDCQLADANLLPYGPTRQANIKKHSFSMKHFDQGSCMAIRRPILEAALPFPKICSAHDTWLSFVAQSMGGKWITNDCLMLYRRHGSNQSRSKSSLIDTSFRSKLSRSLHIRRRSRIVNTRLIEIESYAQTLEENLMAVQHFSTLDKRQIASGLSYARSTQRQIAFIKNPRSLIRLTSPPSKLGTSGARHQYFSKKEFAYSFILQRLDRLLAQ